MTKNSNDEINSENVIKIPKEIGDLSDGDESTMFSSEVEEMGPYYKKTHINFQIGATSGFFISNNSIILV